MVFCGGGRGGEEEQEKRGFRIGRIRWEEECIKYWLKMEN